MEVVTAAASKKVTPFRFAILTDSHLFSIEDHKFDAFLAHAVAQVNAMKPLPDFVVYCGDIAQNGRDDQLQKGQRILSKLTMPIHFIPGEHDWYLDLGEAWRGRFGKPTTSFDHKGVHFIGMNSILVRDFWTAAGMTAKQRMDTMEMLESPIAGPWGVREEQLEWLKQGRQGAGLRDPSRCLHALAALGLLSALEFPDRGCARDSRDPLKIRARHVLSRTCASDRLQQDRQYVLGRNLVDLVAVALPGRQSRLSEHAHEPLGSGARRRRRRSAAHRLEAGFQGTMHWDPFGDMLNPAVKDGFTI